MDSSADNSTVRRCQPETDHRLCSGGCGFFGSEANRGFCSKCYEDYLKRQIATTEAAICQKPVASESEPDQIDHVLSSDLVNLTDAMSSFTIGADINRCGCCNKKVGLLGFRCRCGRTFCGSHRYAESHACNFDYKTAGRVALEKQNPLCRADKMRDRS